MGSSYRLIDMKPAERLPLVADVGNWENDEVGGDEIKAWIRLRRGGPPYESPNRVAGRHNGGLTSLRAQVNLIVIDGHIAADTYYKVQQPEKLHNEKFNWNYWGAR